MAVAHKLLPMSEISRSIAQAVLSIEMRHERCVSSSVACSPASSVLGSGILPQRRNRSQVHADPFCKTKGVLARQ